jgi:nicotinate dehydrogenase subunit B
MKDKPSLRGFTRREFMKVMGGGVVVFFTVGDWWDPAEAQQRGIGRENPADFNAYLRVGEDGKVTCFTGKVELGQGIVTSLAQIAAEELDLPLDRVDIVMGDTALCPWDMGTFGSRTIRYFGPALREAAAEARAVLIELASERMEIPADRLGAEEGFVFDKENPDKRVSYGSLTGGKRIERRAEPKAGFKSPSRYTISGKPAQRKDALLKVTGKALYAGDIRIPDMLHARILRPPAHGARLKSLDLTGAEQFKDARIIRDGELIAVLHASSDQAEKALSKVKAEYDVPEGDVDEDSIHEHLLNKAPGGDVVEERGDLEQGIKLSAAVVERTYRVPYVAHAPLEPHTALVKIEKDAATAWVSTQRPFGDQDVVAQILGLPREKVRIITPFVGGGFGGKTRNRQVVEAARLARLAGKPVQVAWSREEEFFYDTFQPAAVVKIRAGLDAAHKVVLWDYMVYFAGERSSQVFYDIAHCRVVASGHWGRGAAGVHPFEVGAWRAPGSNTNAFARESHMDILAEEAGVDPVEFRMANLKDERMKRVLGAAAEAFGWSPAKGPSGRGFGAACADYLGTYVATMAEVAVDKKSGSVRVKRVVCAQDMGQVINPEGAKAQIEGCITMGLGYALAEEIHFKGGRIRDRNFDTYEIPRFSWVPRIDTILIDNQDMPALGGGEPPIVNMGAVIANAVYDASGARLFRLPMTPARIKESLNKIDIGLKSSTSRRKF